ncbi:replication endonuclease [Chitinolyticbacter albus]|uniref:replication endonuclease n=1 Tax=Chitinolyticbacter albus TaxID=2961951 RepID=UPI00210D6230|nr:replication endonuclease [Chitinolyticbacter albus]
MIELIKAIDYNTLQAEFNSQYKSKKLIIKHIDLSGFLSKHFHTYTQEQAFKQFLLTIIDDYAEGFFRQSKSYYILNLSAPRLYNIIKNIDFRFFKFVAMDDKEIRSYLEFNLQVFFKKLNNEEYKTEFTSRYKSIKSLVTQSFYYLDQCFNLVNEHRPYCSTSFLNNFKKHKIKQFDYLKDTVLIGENNHSINLINVVRTNKQEIAEKINLCRSIEKLAEEKDWGWVFITFTVPPRFHSNPLNGSKKWDGSTVKQAHKYFTERWARIRTNLNDGQIDFMGINVNEFHQDGSPHYHCLMFIDTSNIKTLQGVCKIHFNESSVDFKVEDKKRGDSAKASSYIFKYVSKTLGLDLSLIEKISRNEVLTAEEDNSLAHNAVRTAHRIRGFNMFGVEKSITLYRQFMKTNFFNNIILDTAKNILSKSKTGYADFLELKTQFSMSLIKDVKKSILGIKIQGFDYLKMLFHIIRNSKTHNNNCSTVIVNYPSKANPITKLKPYFTVIEKIANNSTRLLIRHNLI